MILDNMLPDSDCGETSKTCMGKTYCLANDCKNYAQTFTDVLPKQSQISVAAPSFQDMQRRQCDADF